MTNNLMRTVEPWTEGDSEGRFAEMMRHLNWLGRRLYSDYEPNAYSTFDEQFGKWIENVEDEADKKTLFELLEYLFFVGRREFEALCRAAFTGPISRWIIDSESIDVAAADAVSKITAAVKDTWFCPVTDSMRINAFLKLNRIEGKQHRPDWRSLTEFGDPRKIKAYMDTNELKRLVLLEDFVGSGTQMKNTAEFAASCFDSLPVLLCPLVCCPGGVETGEKLAARFENFVFEPILRISGHTILRETAGNDEPAVFARVRTLIASEKKRWLKTNREKPYGFEDVGALVVMYSNCPNNTLPIIHNNSSKWKALFPRIRRN